MTYTVTAKDTTTTKDYAVSVVIAPPANDNFANAIDLTGVGSGQTGNATAGTQTGTDNLQATLETGEPDTVTYPDLDQHVHQHGLVQMDLPGKRRSHR